VGRINSIFFSLKGRKNGEINTEEGGSANQFSLSEISRKTATINFRRRRRRRRSKAALSVE